MSAEKKIEMIKSLMERDESVDALEDSIRWAKNLFRSRPKERSTVRKILAALQMSIEPGKPAFGERSAGGAETRQMLFEAGDHAVDVRITRSARRFLVRGQVVGDDVAECSVTFFNERTVREARGDEFGEFQFENVQPGTYRVSVGLSDAEIFIENLEIS